LGYFFGRIINPPLLILTQVIGCRGGLLSARKGPCEAVREEDASKPKRLALSKAKG